MQIYGISYMYKYHLGFPPAIQIEHSVHTAREERQNFIIKQFLKVCIFFLYWFSELK